MSDDEEKEERLGFNDSSSDSSAETNTKKGRNLNLKSSVTRVVASYKVPETPFITSQELYVAYKCEKKTNSNWTCPFCSSTGQNIGRAFDHCLKKHYRITGILDVLEKFIETCPKSTKQKRAESIQIKRELLDPEAKGKKSTLHKMASFDYEQRVTTAACVAVVDGSLPVNIIEQPWYLESLQAAAEIGFQKARADPKAKNIEIGRFVPDRKKFTIALEKFCSMTITNGEVAHLDSALGYGCTLISDGRSNVNHDPLIVYGVGTEAGFCPLQAIDCGDSKKDADFLKDQMIEVLDDSKFVDSVTSIVTDGAPSCINASKAVAKEELLFDLRCNSHSVSLVLKKISKKVFKEMINDASKLICFLRVNSRVYSIVKDICKKVIFRFIETRFGTHVMACSRLLEVKEKLKLIVGQDSYQTWKADQTKPEKKEEIEYCEEILKDDNFWSEMAMFCHLTLIIVHGLRLMDQSSVRAKDVNAIWDAIETKVAATLTDPKLEKLSTARKQQICEIILNERRNSFRPIYDAAEVLDPLNLERFRKLAKTIDEQAIATWAEKKKNVLKALKTLITRQKLVELRKIEFNKQSEEPPANKKQKKVKVKPSEITVDSDKLDEAVQVAFGIVKQEFFQYIMGTGLYTASKASDSWKDFWEEFGGALKLYAFRILTVQVTASDVERLHKVYSVIHTKARNRTSNTRVERLSHANLFRRAEQKTRTPFSILKLQEFSSLTTEETEQLAEWCNLVNNCKLRTSQTISEPSSEISISAEPILIDSNIPSSTENDANDSESSDESEPDEVMENDDQSDELPSRPKRAIRMTVAMRQAASSIGFTEEFLQNFN